MEAVTSLQSSVTGQEPQITFKSINPTKYLVNVKGAKEPFWLVFSESFHEGWKAYIRQIPDARYQNPESSIQHPEKEPWSALWSAWKDRGNRIEIKDHFVVNGYANGWIVLTGQRQEVRDQVSEGEKRIPEDF